MPFMCVASHPVVIIRRNMVHFSVLSDIGNTDSDLCPNHISLICTQKKTFRKETARSTVICIHVEK